MQPYLRAAAFMTSAFAVTAFSSDPIRNDSVLRNLKTDVHVGRVVHSNDSVSICLTQPIAGAHPRAYTMYGLDVNRNGLDASELTQIDVEETETLENGLPLSRKITMVPGLTVYGAWRSNSGMLYEQNKMVGSKPQFIEITRKPEEADFQQLGPMDMMELPLMRTLYKTSIAKLKR